tara:strand:+ start:91 stop:780 length:690 start_codon:yes stop_codon:yes gene_type:complete
MKFRDLLLLKICQDNSGPLTSHTFDTEALEDALEGACGGNLQITHRLELRQLVTSLLHDAKIKKQGTTHQHHVKECKALSNFKANLQRRKKTSDTLTSSRLMEIPEPARAILLADIAYRFHGAIDDYTQLNFGNFKHMKLLKAAVDSSIRKITNKQGRPVNKALDEFFVGLKNLYESATGKPAIAGAHFDGEPKTDFEKLMYLGYQIIRPAYQYPSALKAYERAIARSD